MNTIKWLQTKLKNWLQFTNNGKIFWCGIKAQRSEIMVKCLKVMIDWYFFRFLCWTVTIPIECWIFHWLECFSFEWVVRVRRRSGWTSPWHTNPEHNPQQPICGAKGTNQTSSTLSKSGRKPKSPQIKTVFRILKKRGKDFISLCFALIVWNWQLDLRLRED